MASSCGTGPTAVSRCESRSAHHLPVRRLSATQFETPQLAQPEWLEETWHDPGESLFGIAIAAAESFHAEAVPPQPPSEQSQSPHRRTGSSIAGKCSGANAGPWARPGLEPAGSKRTSKSERLRNSARREARLRSREPRTCSTVVF